MRKRDSIEFLWDELKSFLPANYTVDESVKILSILKQAKEMHKEEIIDSHESGMADGYYFEGSQSDYESEGATKYFGEQHYEQTFGGNNEQQ